MVFDDSPTEAYSAYTEYGDASGPQVNKRYAMAGKDQDAVGRSGDSFEIMRRGMSSGEGLLLSISSKETGLVFNLVVEDGGGDRSTANGINVNERH